MEEMKSLIEAAFEDRTKLPEARAAVLEALELLTQGKIRVAVQKSQGDWEVQAWVKKAILLYFGLQEMREMEAGEFKYYDKIAARTDHRASGVRVVPPAVIRYGAFAEKGAILMPSYVNIGAYVGSGTMVDTWATVGSCAQIGKGVHLSGGVGIGGVLEPPQGRPVIVEDGAFLGSRAIVVEGVMIEEKAVIGANVTLTASTPIIDVTGPTEVVYKGRVPRDSVVIPGMREKEFASGKYGVPCALIIGKRKSSTDEKTSLNDALRDFEVSV
jgi:2,3,4,5-tetrahydropyridine-2-carboxylate N-succinyltransferase